LLTRIIIISSTDISGLEIRIENTAFYFFGGTENFGDFILRQGLP